jgi:hypothetical protein
MEKIAKVALKLNGKTYSAPVGSSHEEIRSEHALQGKGRGTRGFITSTGSFVNREEAASIAKRAGQTKRPVTDGKLHSSDLKEKSK